MAEAENPNAPLIPRNRRPLGDITVSSSELTNLSPDGVFLYKKFNIKPKKHFNVTPRQISVWLFGLRTRELLATNN